MAVDVKKKRTGASTVVATSSRRTAWKVARRRISALNTRRGAWLTSSARVCGHRGCNRHPTYGMEDSKTAECCTEHKREGMVDVGNKRHGHHRFLRLHQGAFTRREKDQSTSKVDGRSFAFGEIFLENCYGSQDGREHRNIFLAGRGGSCEANCGRN